MLLSRALRLEPTNVVAFTGAGGKTTAIRTLVAEITKRLVPGIDRVLVSTTTRLGQEQANVAAHHLIDPSADAIAVIPELLSEHRSILVSGPLTEEDGKWTGVQDGMLEHLVEIAQRTGVTLLIEADGARGRRLKAPAEHEPVIPAVVNLVVPMARLDALGQRLESGAVHRPEIVAALLELDPGARLGPGEIAGVLSHSQGGLKGAPPSAQVRVLITKAEEARLGAGRQIADELLATARIQAVVFADLMTEDPVPQVRSRVAGVVLAAGGSSRLGEPKQLIEWRGEPLVLHAIRAAREGGLDPVVVVLGESADEIRRALKEENLQIVENSRWREGQSTSVRVGLEIVEADAEAVIFLLADMPFVGPDLVRALVDKHAETLSPLVAPWVGGRRANPLLFDRVTYRALRGVEGDRGGRSIFKRFDRVFVEWEDTILFDVDTPADLERLRQME